jgi:hypothetical protein
VRKCKESRHWAKKRVAEHKCFTGPRAPGGSRQHAMSSLSRTERNGNGAYSSNYEIVVVTAIWWPTTEDHKCEPANIRQPRAPDKWKMLQISEAAPCLLQRLATSIDLVTFTERKNLILNSIHSWSLSVDHRNDDTSVKDGDPVATSGDDCGIGTGLARPCGGGATFPNSL